MSTQEAIEMISEAVHERNFVKAIDVSCLLQRKFGLSKAQVYSLAHNYTGISLADWNSLVSHSDKDE